MKLAVLTCERLPELLPSDKPLISLLAERGINATPAVWNDYTIDWSGFNALLFRNTWDYYQLETEFNQWLSQIQSLGIKTLNPIETIQQNKHKFYLKRLEAQGIQIIPTRFINKTNQLNLKSLWPETWEKAVIKPAFSAGSYLTEVFKKEKVDEINQKYAPIAKTKELLFQQYIPEIETLGETSFIFFDKKFSHAVNKKPETGDFRVQVQFGGQYTLINPEKNILKTAENIIATYREPLVYARVDGIIINGSFTLMEVELIEPDLYFSLKPSALTTFASAIAKNLFNP